MPISDGSPSNVGTQMPGMGAFNMNIPGFQAQNAMPQNLGADFGSIMKMLQTQPQSLTNSMMPGLSQILGLQSNAMQGMFGNQTAGMVSGAQSDAMARGMTGSSIEAANMLGARQAGNYNMNQFMGQQLGQLGTAYQGAMGQDVGNQNQMYQNIAQALGQQMQAQQAYQMFQQQMQQQSQLAGQANNAALWGAGIGALGSMGGGALMHYSDDILKNNIRKIDEIKGIGLYEFDYRDDMPSLGLPVGKRIGFMAQEVIKKFPQFVQKVNGFFAVDYISLANALEA